MTKTKSRNKKLFEEAFYKETVNMELEWEKGKPFAIPVGCRELRMPVSRHFNLFLAGQKAGKKSMSESAARVMCIRTEMWDEKVEEFRKIMNNKDYTWTMIYSEFNRIFMVVKK